MCSSDLTGNHVFLVLNNGVVEGRVAATQAEALLTQVISFTVSVNGATGDVTLDQQRAVLHAPNSGPDQETSLAAADLITLNAVVTDKDGDTAPAAINLGDAISFKDDAPALTSTQPGNDTLQVDETSLNVDKTVNFANLFTPAYGADGAGNVGSYTLTVKSAGVDSGIVDTATGNHVFLVLNNGVVEGRVAATQAEALLTQVKIGRAHV